MVITADILAAAVADNKEMSSSSLGHNDSLFVERIFHGGIEKYLRRLNAIELKNFDNVLDAGCGFGQWSIALSQTNGTVH